MLQSYKSSVSSAQRFPGLSPGEQPQFRNQGDSSSEESCGSRYFRGLTCTANSSSIRIHNHSATHTDGCSSMAYSNPILASAAMHSRNASYGTDGTTPVTFSNPISNQIAMHSQTLDEYDDCPPALFKNACNSYFDSLTSMNPINSTFGGGEAMPSSGVSGPRLRPRRDCRFAGTDSKYLQNYQPAYSENSLYCQGNSGESATSNPNFKRNSKPDSSFYSYSLPTGQSIAGSESTSYWNTSKTGFANSYCEATSSASKDFGKSNYQNSPADDYYLSGNVAQYQNASSNGFMRSSDRPQYQCSTYPTHTVSTGRCQPNGIFSRHQNPKIPMDTTLSETTLPLPTFSSVYSDVGAGGNHNGSGWTNLHSSQTNSWTPGTGSTLANTFSHVDGHTNEQMFRYMHTNESNATSLGPVAQSNRLCSKPDQDLFTAGFGTNGYPTMNYNGSNFC